MEPRGMLAIFPFLIACATPIAPLPDAAGDAAAPIDAVVPVDSAQRDAARADAARDDAGIAFGPAMALGTTPTSLPEISGIVASRTHDGVYWVENDSGNPPEVYAVTETGTLLATIVITGATNVDWEDIALAPGASGDDLYIPDFGNNAARDSGGTMGRTTVRLYRLAEPDPAAGDQTLTAEAIDVRYPSAPHDCEAVLVEPTSGDVYLVSKEHMPPARVFVARAPLVAGATAVLEDLGPCDIGLATAADIRRDGAEIALRNYGQIRVYPVLSGDIAASLASSTFTVAPSGSPAEAVCFDADDRDLLTISEGAGATLFRIPRR